MADLKVPTFMKKKESIAQEVGKQLEKAVIVEKADKADKAEIVLEDTAVVPSEMPVEPRITIIKAHDYEEPVDSMDWDDSEAYAALTEAEKDGIRKTIGGMIKDPAQLEIVLEEIPMEMIIAHLDKKWKEAETFRRNISMALGGGNK